MASVEDGSSARLPRRSAMLRAGPGGAGRRADGEALRLGIFSERTTPDAELDTEQTDIQVCWINFLAVIPSEISIQSGLPHLLEML